MSLTVDQTSSIVDTPMPAGQIDTQANEEALRRANSRAVELHYEIDGLDARIEAPYKNLVDIQEEVQRVLTSLPEILHSIETVQGADEQKRDLVALQRRAQAIANRLQSEPLRELFKEQKKWVECGFDRKLLETDPDAVHFAVASKLIYTIDMFAKSADILKGEMLTIRNIEGVAHFKVQGEWRPFADFKDQILYSENEGRFVGWNFVHPEGFIPRDWAEYGHIYPIAKLTREAYARIKAHADQFWGNGQAEIDPGEDKGYIMQVMTTGRDLLPDAWWTKNFKNHFPEHGSIRLITPDGDVYSFGTKMRLPDQDFLCQVSTYLGTGISNVPTPDYEEPRKSDDRLMVCLPVSKKRFDGIIDFADRANKGICFNFARQNCVRFASVVLGLAGVDVNIKTDLHEILRNIFPRLSDIPWIGRPLSALATGVSCVAAWAFDLLGRALSIVPPLKKVADWTVCAGTNLLQRIEAVFWNGLALCFLGGSTSIVPEEKFKEDTTPEVETFRQVVRWRDLFTPDAIPVYYVTKLKDWMKKQKTALHFVNPDHGFCCLDPDKATFRSPLIA